MQVVGIDSGDSSPGASRELASSGATYPVGVDASTIVATRYLVSGFPVTYFLDRRGRVAGVTVGPLGLAALDRWVRHLASGGSP